MKQSIDAGSGNFVTLNAIDLVTTEVRVGNRGFFSSGTVLGNSNGYGGQIHFNRSDEDVETLEWRDDLGLLALTSDLRVGKVGGGCVQNETGAAIAGSCLSDARLKENVSPLQGVLDRVAGLEPVRFSWRSGEFPDRGSGREMHMGLIAQQVEGVFPELVVEDEDGYKRVRYSDVPMLLLQAPREQHAENRELRARISELEAALKGVAPGGALAKEHIDALIERVERLERELP